jgi:hypothetical protein
MKSLMFLSLICAAAVGMSIPGGLKAQTPSADTAQYGPYPTNYKEVIMQWLNKQLIDPDSARIEWDGEPKPTDLGKGSEAVSGYLVNFTVNARNQFGAYTGKQKHSVLIRNGEVIKSMGFGY